MYVSVCVLSVRICIGTCIRVCICEYVCTCMCVYMCVHKHVYVVCDRHSIPLCVRDLGGLDSHWSAHSSPVQIWDCQESKPLYSSTVAVVERLSLNFLLADLLGPRPRVLHIKIYVHKHRHVCVSDLFTFQVPLGNLPAGFRRYGVTSRGVTSVAFAKVRLQTCVCCN